MEEILVLAEHRQGELREITFEMLTLANKLARDKTLKVTTVFQGFEAPQLADGLEKACDHVLQVEDRALARYDADPYLCVLETIIRQRRPGLILIGHTAMGMDLTPALAARLSLPMASDCVGINPAGEGLEVFRQIYGGKIHERLTLKPCDQYIISVRPGSFDADRDQGKSAGREVLPVPTWSGFRGRRFLEYREAAAEDVDITAADILVSVGRGIGKPENLPAAREFADAIGATLSCSRPVADEGWLPKSRQVGTSGKTVRPKIYIALGISGAYQHQAGMKNAETIIAVNTDPRAPIFSFAHYGIVGDLMQVLPMLREKFES